MKYKIAGIAAIFDRNRKISFKSTSIRKCLQNKSFLTVLNASWALNILCLPIW